MRAFTLFILLAPSVSSAEPSTYVGATGILGGYVAGGGIEVGHRLRDEPVWLRAELLVGTLGFSEVQDWTGPIQQLRVGIEWRSCTTTGRFCGAFGIDAGAQRFAATYWDGSMPDFVRYEGVVAPRALLDFGGVHVRGRFGLEAGALVGKHVEGEPSGYVGLVAGVGVRW